MFCMQCGKPIPDESTVCPECGAQQAAAPTPPSNAASTVSSAAQTATAAASGAVSKFMALPKRTIAKIAILLAMISFFFPFVTVSCSGGGKNLEETYSGFELITTAGSDDDELLDESGDDGKTNIWLIGGFVAAAAGLVVLCLKKKPSIGAACSAVGIACLWLFNLTFKSYYDIKGTEFEQYINLDFRWGLSLCRLLLFAAIICCLLAHNEEKSSG